jgi:hypothetical protein
MFDFYVFLHVLLSIMVRFNFNQFSNETYGEGPFNNNGN